MKIAFHIVRMNWYRMLSSMIDEALRRGYHVECWHNAGASQLGELCSDIKKIPEFRNGKPKVIEYWQLEDFLKLVKDNKVDVIVDILPPDEKIMELWPEREHRPYWVMLDGPATSSVMNIRSRKQLVACDLLAMKSKAHIELCSEMKRQKSVSLINKIKNNSHIIGSVSEKTYKFILSGSWDDRADNYFQQHAVAVGQPQLDDLNLIDADEVRQQWGIPAGKRVLAYLPSPYRGGDGLCCSLFHKNNMFSRLFEIIKCKSSRGIAGLTLNKVTERAVLKGLRQFCDRHNAVLITKLRKQMNANKDIITYSDIVLGEDNYYPHTILELFSISDLAVGYYSTGVIESIAADTFFLNIEIPLQMTDILFDVEPVYKHCFNKKGVTSTICADELSSYLAKYSFDDFIIDPISQKQYLQFHLMDNVGNSTASIIDEIEKLAI